MTTVYEVELVIDRIQSAADGVRALAYEFRVLLMDEPFAAVDAQTGADLEDLVRRLWRERGITICSSPTTSTRPSTWASGSSSCPPHRPSYANS